MSRASPSRWKSCIEGNNQHQGGGIYKGQTYLSDAERVLEFSCTVPTPVTVGVSCCTGRQKTELTHRWHRERGNAFIGISAIPISITASEQDENVQNGKEV